MLNFIAEIYKHRAQFIKKAEFAVGDIGSTTERHVCLNNSFEMSYWRTFFYQPHEYHEEDVAPKRVPNKQPESGPGADGAAAGEGYLQGISQRDALLEHRRHILNVSPSAAPAVVMVIVVVQAWLEALDADVSPSDAIPSTVVSSDHKVEPELVWNQNHQELPLGCTKETISKPHKLKLFVATAFYIAVLAWIISVAIVSEDQRRLKNQFHDRAWLIAVKTMRPLVGNALNPLTLQPDIDGLWVEYQNNIHDQLGWVLGATHLRSRQWLDITIYAVMVLGTMTQCLYPWHDLTWHNVRSVAVFAAYCFPAAAVDTNEGPHHGFEEAATCVFDPCGHHLRFCLHWVLYSFIRGCHSMSTLLAT